MMTARIADIYNVALVLFFTRDKGYGRKRAYDLSVTGRADL